MLALNFTLTGMTIEEFEQHIDNAIALNDPQAAVQEVSSLIQRHDIRCVEVEEYLEKTPGVYGSPAFLIYGTYFRIKASARDRAQFLDPDFRINKYEIWNSDKCCLYCQKLAKKSYRKSNLPELPHHVGCVCMLFPIFD